MTPLDILRQLRVALRAELVRLEGEIAGLDRAIAILSETDSAASPAAEPGSAASNDRIEAATPSTPGDRASGAAALPRPAEPPGTRPPAEAPAKPAGASSPPAGGTVKARVLEALRRYAESGEKLPTNDSLGAALGINANSVSAYLSMLAAEGLIEVERRAGGARRVRLPGEGAAAPAGEEEEPEAAPEAPAAVAVEAAEVARFLRDACAMRVVALPGETFWLDGVKVDRAGLVARANARRRERGLPPFVLVGGAA